MNCFRSTFLCCLLLTLTGCIADKNLKLPYSGFNPSQLNDGWVISTPNDQGLDEIKLEQIYRTLFDEAEFTSIRSLLLVRHGNLVGEAYFRDTTDQTRPHHIQSVTKSVASLLVGIAIDQDSLVGVDVRAYDLLPESFDNVEAKRNITLGDLLTMRDGLGFDNGSDNDALIYQASNSLRYILGKDLVNQPGTTFHYNDGAPTVSLAMIQQATEQNITNFAVENLFSPLGISDYHWELHPDGLAYGGYGLWLLPRDMAKIGLLCLDEGSWQGNQIVTTEWLLESTQTHVPDASPTPYGYYWWILEGHNGYRAYGHGGQMIIVLTDLDLVAVITADSNADPVVSDGPWDFAGFLDDLAASVVD